MMNFPHIPPLPADPVDPKDQAVAAVAEEEFGRGWALSQYIGWAVGLHADGRPGAVWQHIATQYELYWGFESSVWVLMKPNMPGCVTNPELGHRDILEAIRWAERKIDAPTSSTPAPPSPTAPVDRRVAELEEETFGQSARIGELEAALAAAKEEAARATILRENFAGALSTAVEERDKALESVTKATDALRQATAFRVREMQEREVLRDEIGYWRHLNRQARERPTTQHVTVNYGTVNNAADILRAATEAGVKAGKEAMSR